MVVLELPFHLDERLPRFATGAAAQPVAVAPLPAGDPWSRMAVLYERVAVAVQAAAGAGPVVVLSGDCTSSLGVLAGLQRAVLQPAVVWFDGHADLHTEATTTSGYLGGMPLALAVGLGTLTLPSALGLRPVPQDRVVLVDARDTDPAEHALLARSRLRRSTVADLDQQTLPEGPVYLHLDVDVCDPVALPGLLYPAPRGPSPDDVVAAVGRIAAQRQIAGVGLAATWAHDGSDHAALHGLVRWLAPVFH